MPFSEEYMWIGLLLGWLLWAMVSSEKWKAKYLAECEKLKKVEELSGSDGWIEECRFWRHHFDAESAKHALDEEVE